MCLRNEDYVTNVNARSLQKLDWLALEKPTRAQWNTKEQSNTAISLCLFVMTFRLPICRESCGIFTMRQISDRSDRSDRVSTGFVGHLWLGRLADPTQVQHFQAGLRDATPPEGKFRSMILVPGSIATRSWHEEPNLCLILAWILEFLGFFDPAILKIFSFDKVGD